MLLCKTLIGIAIIVLVLSWLMIKYDWCNGLGCDIMILGALVLFAGVFMGLMIFGENTQSNINSTIIEKTIEYNGLCRELELVEAGDEAFVKSEVYKEVLKYNEYVTGYKNCADNRWLVGLYSKEIADNLQLIDF